MLRINTLNELTFSTIYLELFVKRAIHVRFLLSSDINLNSVCLSVPTHFMIIIVTKYLIGYVTGQVWPLVRRIMVSNDHNLVTDPVWTKLHSTIRQKYESVVVKSRSSIDVTCVDSN